MTRREQLHALLGPTTVEGLPGRICDLGIAELGVDGVGIALIADSQARTLLAASGSFVGGLEAAQFDLSQGPCLEAQATGDPVLAPDLAADGSSRWPLFTETALSLGVGAVFVFPLRTGRTRFGVLDAARATPGPLDDEQLETALALAALASEAVLLLQGLSASVDDSVAAISTHRIVVHQASGMVSVQAAIGVTDALAWLRARAYLRGRTLEDLSADVVARREAFEAL